MKNLTAVLILGIFIFTSCDFTNPKLKKVRIMGQAQGTYYAVTYYDKDSSNYQKEIDSILRAFDKSVSIYEPNSIISRINNNVPSVKLDNYFVENFKLSIEISRKTDGAFDITVGPLINAWGFGLQNKANITEDLIDSLKTFIGYEKIRIKDKQVIKDDPRININFNAIAQGYSVDVIAEFLDSKGIKNYLIDIGGEVLAKGTKENMQLWRVGIQTPTTDKFGKIEAQTIIELNNIALATSGSYRTYYEEDDIRYSHTIDPSSGYPVSHSLLSVSVLADDCATADAYATAFMVMGVEKAKAFLSKNKNLDAYFIFSSPEEECLTYGTKGIMEIISSE